MACTVTVDTAFATLLGEIVTALNDINTTLQAMNNPATAGSVAYALATFNTFSASLLSVSGSAQLNIGLGSSIGGSGNELTLLRQALVADGFTIPGFDRISPDHSASLAQRIVQDDVYDPTHSNLGALGDRVSPKPTDVQCDAEDLAWSTNPGTDNVADQIADLCFGSGCPDS